MTQKDLTNFKVFRQEVENFLKSQQVVLCKESRDGRVNSQKDEDIIIELLNEHYADYIVIPEARHWFDIMHKQTKTPINIKSTSMAGTDNASNFLSLLYCFTDLKIKPERRANKTKDWKELVTWLKNNTSKVHENNRDYWFLVVSKNNTKEVFWNSLKKLPSPTLNPSNMPFQVNWEKNKNICQRTHEESLVLYYKLVHNGIKKIINNWEYDNSKEVFECLIK
jgi:hypothetical protein